MKHDAQAVIASEPDDFLTSTFEKSFTNPTLDRPASAIVISAVAAAARDTGQPFLTTAMRLYAHHVLRC
jgi:hypothetical protein